MGSNGVTRVVIADDHPVVCVGLATLIAAHGWEVCATAADGEEAVARATELRPDIVVMNYEMHCQSGSDRLNGLEAARQIERELPQVEILYSAARARVILFFRCTAPEWAAVRYALRHGLVD